MSESSSMPLDDDDTVPSNEVTSPEMLHRGEACAMLKCEWLTLRGLLADGTLPGLKISKVWVIPRAAFIQRVNALASEQAAERQLLTRTAALGADDFGAMPRSSPAQKKSKVPVPAAPPPLHPRWEKWRIKTPPDS
jgi:hypothetical protein